MNVNFADTGVHRCDKWPKTFYVCHKDRRVVHPASDSNHGSQSEFNSCEGVPPSLISTTVHAIKKAVILVCGRMRAVGCMYACGHACDKD